jgi:hypothetical protein
MSLLRHSNVKERLERLRKLQGKVEHLRKFAKEFDNDEFLQWDKVEVSDLRFDNEIVPGAGVLTQLIDWCNDNCSDSYVAYRGDFFFKSPTDAAFMIMVWK